MIHSGPHVEPDSLGSLNMFQDGSNHVDVVLVEGCHQVPSGSSHLDIHCQTDVGLFVGIVDEGLWGLVLDVVIGRVSVFVGFGFFPLIVVIADFWVSEFEIYPFIFEIFIREHSACIQLGPL